MLLSTEHKETHFLRKVDKYLKYQQGVPFQKRTVRTKNFAFALFSDFASNNINVRQPQSWRLILSRLVTKELACHNIVISQDTQYYDYHCTGCMGVTMR